MRAMSEGLPALILDMDGVLADTEGIHVRAWDIALSAIVGATPGGPGAAEMREARIGLAGMSSPAIARELIRVFRLPFSVESLVEKKRAVFRRLIEIELAPFDGLREELQKWRGGPLALATSSARAETTLILGRMGFEGWFDPIVTSDDVSRAKPAPDCYALAIQRLGVPPARCVAVEDSLHGIQAARSAGASVLAVATSELPERIDGVLGIFPSTVAALKWLRR
jgi:HAD superfamily hydrolase (TIGR01509 family)